MKKFLVILIMALFLLPVTFKAQWHGGMHGKMGRLLQWEQMKIIDVLNLDEETAIKLFARRRKNLDNQLALVNKKKELGKELKSAIENNDTVKCDSLISKAFEIDKKLIENKEKFYRSLSDILTKKQIAQLVLFENRFKDELRKYFLRRGRGG